MLLLGLCTAGLFPIDIGTVHSLISGKWLMLLTVFEPFLSTLFKIISPTNFLSFYAFFLGSKSQLLWALGEQGVHFVPCYIPRTQTVAGWLRVPAVGGSCWIHWMRSQEGVWEEERRGKVEYFNKEGPMQSVLVCGATWCVRSAFLTWEGRLWDVQ